MQRRHFLTGAVLTAATAATQTACGSSQASTTQGGSNTMFLLVHGAWHSAHHWNRVANLLAEAGHSVEAVDLPGNGLKATYPLSYLSGDQAAFTTETSPQASVTLQDYVDVVVSAIRKLSAAGRKIILVGHSAGGLTITRAAEQVPDLLARIVYVTAHCPTSLPSMADYVGLPENNTAQLGNAFVGDPFQIGAFRLNPRSTDPAYLEACRNGFYNDLQMSDALPYLLTLGTELPLGPITADARGTAGRWGTIPRTFVRCTLDHALPLALQDLIIKQVDAMTPNNKFDVRSLESSHSPFASKPAELAQILASLA